MQIYVHSVCPYHAASVETARTLLFLLKPAVTAIGIDNTYREGLEKLLAKRKALAKDKNDVVRIADGYHRVCLGAALLSYLRST
jgi:hypothetical protein